MHREKIKNRIKYLLNKGGEYLKTDLIYFTKGSFWLFFGQVGAWIFSFGLATLLANILPKEFFGNYQFVLAIAGTIGAFSLTGMNAAVTRAVAQGKDKVFKESISTQIKWNGLMMAAGLLIGIYYFINDNQSVGWSMVAIGLFLPLANAFNTYVAFLNGKRDFKKIAFYGIGASLVVSLFVLGASLTYISLPFIIGIYSILTFIVNFVAYKIIIRNHQFNDAFDESSIKYGKHLSLVNALFSFSQELDKIFLFHYLGGVVLASYFLATLIPENIKNFIKLVNPLSLPKFSQRNISEIRENIYYKLIISLVVSICLALAYIIIAPILFHFVFPQYLDAIKLTRIYSLIIVFSGPMILMMSVLNSQAMVKQVYIFNITTFIVKLLVVFFGIKIAGVYGLVWGMVILYAVMTITLFILMSKTNKKPL